MSITLIDNQTVRFQLLTEIEQESCDCSVKLYCQKVNKFDVTKYQIISNTILSNGDFIDGLTGWEITVNIVIDVEQVNESEEGACDGSLTLTPYGGSSPYEYSNDGGVNYQSSNLFDGLCTGCYVIIVKDDDGNIGVQEYCIETSVDCSLFAGSETNDLTSYTTNQLLNCETNDFI